VTGAEALNLIDITKCAMCYVLLRDLSQSKEKGTCSGLQIKLEAVITYQKSVWS
jgi:hypothetical protein